jgi:serine protease Do
MTMIPKYTSILALILSAYIAVPPAVAQEAAAPPAPAAQAQVAQPTNAFVELAPRLIPAVVNITARRDAAAPDGPARRSPVPPGSPFEDFFRDFFGGPGQPDRGPQAPQQQRRAVGSGFIIDPEGYIVTNHHVVEDATAVTVVLYDETEYEAQIVGLDPRTDLAVLKIDARSDLPYVEWGDSEESRIGEPVLAIGNPFGLGGTVTSGIISALARDLGIGPYDEFLQTDASINRGNSGGPLFNVRGEVIGVATAIFSPTGGFVGIGFATPSALARAVVDDLRETGEVRRGWIGVAIQAVSEEIASGLGMDEPRGVVVADVTPGAPADQAGIEVGDVLLEFNDRPIDERLRLPRLVADTKIGSTVPVTVWRDGDIVTLQITVGDLSQAPGTAAIEPQLEEPEDPDAQPRLGLQLAPLDAQMRRQLGLGRDVTCVVVAGVEPDSAAAERGVRTGDLIVRVGRQEVTQPEEVVQAVREARERGEESILLLIRREDGTRFVSMPIATG